MPPDPYRLPTGRCDAGYRTAVIGCDLESIRQRPRSRPFGGFDQAVEGHPDGSHPEGTTIRFTCHAAARSPGSCSPRRAPPPRRRPQVPTSLCCPDEAGRAGLSTRSHTPLRQGVSREVARKTVRGWHTPCGSWQVEEVCHPSPTVRSCAPSVPERRVGSSTACSFPSQASRPRFPGEAVLGVETAGGR